MATKLLANGIRSSVPRSATEVDASGLASQGLTATGIVAVLGTAIGGIPVLEGDPSNISADTGTHKQGRLPETSALDPMNLPTFNTPAQALRAYRSGDLLEVAPYLFQPARDQNIPAGAQQIIACKVDPSSRSSLVLLGGDGLSALTLKTREYGADSEQANIQVRQATNTGSRGRRFTSFFEDLMDDKDDVGGTALATLQYKPGANGWGLMTSGTQGSVLIDVDATGKFVARAKRTSLGVPVTAALGANGTLNVLAPTADAGKILVIYGRAPSGAPQREVLTLDGNGDATGVRTWLAGSIFGTALYDATGAFLSTVSTGGLTVVDTAGPTVILTIAAASSVAGGFAGVGMFVEPGQQIAAQASGAAAGHVMVFGRTASGGQVSEVATLPGANTDVTLALTTIAIIDFVVIGDVSNAVTVTLSANAVMTRPAAHKTFQKVADYFNARRASSAAGLSAADVGFFFVFLTGNITAPVTDFDVVTGADARQTSGVTATASLYGDLAAQAAYFAQSSRIFTATRTPGGIGPVALTAGAVYARGGEDGVANVNDYQRALNILKRRHVASVLVLTPNDAVRAALSAHLDDMCGPGRDERDGFAPLYIANGDGTFALYDKSTIKTKIAGINSEKIRAYAQSVDQFDTNGDLVTFPPWMQAAIAAGMQSGCAIGLPLTHKYGRVQGVHQDASWNPMEDGDEMIESGLMFMESIETKGIRWVRNITTWLRDDNLAFIEGSVNQEVNVARSEFRDRLEAIIGLKGFTPTLKAAKGAAVGVLNELVREGVLVTWRALTMVLEADRTLVDVEIAPVLPINFVRSVIHLVTVQQAA